MSGMTRRSYHGRAADIASADAAILIKSVVCDVCWDATASSTRCPGKPQMALNIRWSEIPARGTLGSHPSATLTRDAVTAALIIGWQRKISH
jgi:hypothetical protein